VARLRTEALELAARELRRLFKAAMEEALRRLATSAQAAAAALARTARLETLEKLVETVDQVFHHQSQVLLSPARAAAVEQ
jgi:hypothetical protein